MVLKNTYLKVVDLTLKIYVVYSITGDINESCVARKLNDTAKFVQDWNIIQRINRTYTGLIT